MVAADWRPRDPNLSLPGRWWWWWRRKKSGGPGQNTAQDSDGDSSPAVRIEYLNGSRHAQALQELNSALLLFGQALSGRQPHLIELSLIEDSQVHWYRGTTMFVDQNQRLIRIRRQQSFGKVVPDRDVRLDDRVQNRQPRFALIAPDGSGSSGGNIRSPYVSQRRDQLLARRLQPIPADQFRRPGTIERSRILDPLPGERQHRFFGGSYLPVRGNLNRILSPQRNRQATSQKESHW